MKEEPKITLSFGETEHTLKHGDLDQLDKLATKYIREMSSDKIKDVEFMRQVNEVLTPIKSVLKASDEFLRRENRERKFVMATDNIAAPELSGMFLEDFQRLTVNGKGEQVVVKPIYLDFFEADQNGVFTLPLFKFAYTPAVGDYASINGFTVTRIYYTEPGSQRIQAIDTPCFTSTPDVERGRLHFGWFTWERGSLRFTVDRERGDMKIETSIDEGYRLVAFDLLLDVFG